MISSMTQQDDLIIAITIKIAITITIKIKANQDIITELGVDAHHSHTAMSMYISIDDIIDDAIKSQIKSIVNRHRSVNISTTAIIHKMWFDENECPHNIDMGNNESTNMLAWHVL